MTLAHSHTILLTSARLLAEGVSSCKGLCLWHAKRLLWPHLVNDVVKLAQVHRTMLATVGS